MTVLVLGGTGEARDLAAALHGRGERVVSSLAGRVANPRLPAGEVRTGGFGGADGLAAWLRAHRIRAVVDATHPFAQRISANAMLACAATATPLLRLERPAWASQPGDRWHRVADVPAAAALVGRLGERVLLTTGRQGLRHFAGVETCWFLARCVQAPDPPLPPCCEVLLDRGPYTPEGEGRLLDEHRIEVLVTKESGGPMTEAKLAAARARGLPVVVVRRPPRGAVAAVAEVTAALRWLDDHPG